MPRGITEALINQKLGTEPILLVEFLGRTYSTKGDDGKIMSVTSLDSVVKLRGSGASASISVTLDDIDGSIKALMSSEEFNKVPAKVFQTYDNIGADPPFLLFSGEISSPIKWSEGERTVTINILQEIESKEIGFSPEEGEFEFIADSAVGKAWPLVFGSPVRVPAVKITEKVRGNSLTRYGAISIGNLEDLCSRAGSWANAEFNKRLADANAGFSDTNYAGVIDSLTGAVVSLNLALSNLIGDAPNQENNLRDFIEACRQIVLNTIDFDLQTINVSNLEDELEILDGKPAIPAIPIGSPGNPFNHPRLPSEENDIPAVPATDGTIVTLEAQILQSQVALDALGTQPQTPTRDAAMAALIITINQLTIQLNTANSDGRQVSSDLEFAKLLRSVALINIGIFEERKIALTLVLTRITLATIIVEHGEDFPQGVTVIIIAKGMKFSGQFAGEVFTVETANIPFFSGVASGARENDNVNEYFTQDASINLEGKYCYFANKGVVFIDQQDGTRCFFSPLLYEQTGALALIEGESDFTREIFDPEIITAPINQATVYIDAEWVASLRRGSIPDFASGLSQFTSRDWSLEIGDDIYLDGNYTDVYIANLIPSVSIHEVMAFRTVKGIRKLLPVPSRLYTVTLSEDIAGQKATTIRISKPLTEFDDQNWEEQLFVSLVSTVGPNTAEIMEYLASNYTDLAIDATSFVALNIALDPFPSHFAILDRPDALTTLEAIAFQARSAVFVKDKVLFGKFLAVAEAGIITITETETEFGTFILNSTLTEDIVTKFVAEWISDYSEEEPNELVLRNNIGKYGTIEEVFNYFIYNFESLVKLSLTFWVIRKSNIYKIVTLQGFLNTLELEPFDSVDLTFINDLISTDPSVVGIVQKASYDYSDESIIFDILTPVWLGQSKSYPAFYGPAPGPAEYPTKFDKFAGGATS